ncbi:unnamed protein product [Kuraishia capsulata CBS 1993]|uniref:Succinate-semialdehyde dehydrogenase n=1 Tax=Kuraishia capsulata CBS 1993 TaxID=1382522 RepID=W6MUU5_9ASCO|nr:uncharacterized protein KUCA_T00005539001 [Kuraishia capsulata CBS 1993]CDK29547.1 unnamed protein product [Kuraishia capsulata CBS 1993]
MLRCIHLKKSFSQRSYSLASHLKNPDLLKVDALINGKWIAGDETFTVKNPASLEPIAEVSSTSLEDINSAINAASDSFISFGASVPRHRADLLTNFYELMMENIEDLAKLVTLENGKPLADAIGEVKYSASFLKWFGEEAPRLYGDTIPSTTGSSRILTMRQPVGVVGILTPWNFPSAMITRKLGAAIAAGCTAVIKPASETPLSALALGHLSQLAGFPAGVVNIVPSSPKQTAEVGKLFCTNPKIQKVSFTGSTRVGKILVEQSSGTLKRLSMELGGNAPFIVFEDADIDKAVQGAMACKFRSSGQTCVCANRLYVHEKVYDEFAAKLVAEVKKTILGRGLDEGVTHGPLIHKKALEKVKEHVNDALSKGASILVGGSEASHLGPAFHELTVLSDVTGDMLAAQEETFGPLAPLIKFSSEDEVLKMANNSEVGLAGYFYSQDYARVFRVGEALQVGMVGVNTGVISEAAMPFGGVKESGFGREGSKYGVEEYTNIKTLVIGGV